MSERDERIRQIKADANYFYGSWYAEELLWLLAQLAEANAAAAAYRQALEYTKGKQLDENN